MQDVLWLSDINTTMNIYADATKEMKDKEFGTFEKYMKATKIYSKGKEVNNVIQNICATT